MGRSAARHTDRRGQAVKRDHASEQPYERVLNDGAEVALFVVSGWAFFGGWLGSFFASLMLLSTIFGDLHALVYWVLFFGTIPVGVWAGRQFQDAPERVQKSPGPLKCGYVESETLGYCHCGRPKVHHA